MNTSNTTTPPRVPIETATRVPDERRLSFFPKYFGERLMMRGERLVYTWLEHLCKDYRGAYWHFYEIPDGSFYLAPNLTGKLLIRAENGFEEELSPDGAGIVATLYALNQLATENSQTRQGGVLLERYHLLRDFACTHPESGLIYRAID